MIVKEFDVREAVPDEGGEARADDPMNDIDAPAAETPRKTRGSGVKRSRNLANNGKVVTVELPLMSPEMYPNCKHKYKARLFVEHRSQVWLHLDDVNWAVKYMYSQYVLKGVAYVRPDDAGPSAADEVEPPAHAGRAHARNGGALCAAGHAEMGELQPEARPEDIKWGFEASQR